MSSCLQNSVKHNDSLCTEKEKSFKYISFFCVLRKCVGVLKNEMQYLRNKIKCHKYDIVTVVLLDQVLHHQSSMQGEICNNTRA